MAVFDKKGKPMDEEMEVGNGSTRSTCAPCSTCDINMIKVYFLDEQKKPVNDLFVSL